MATTPRAAVPYPTPNDDADVPRDVQALADRVAELVGAEVVTSSERDSIGGVDLYPGRLVWVTDADPPGLDVWDGSGWLRVGATDHDALTGLTADDHPQYVPADGSRPLTGPLDADGHRLADVGDPTGEGDAVPRGYGDARYVRSETVRHIVELTETAYDALDPPDPDTLYVVKENGS